MNEEKTEAAQGGLTKIKIGGRKNEDGVKTEARYLSVYIPTPAELIDALNGNGIFSPYAYDMFEKGMVSVIRNDVAIPAGETEQRYPTPSTIEVFVANQEAKLANQANRGAALQERRASIEAFLAFLASVNVKEASLGRLKAIMASADNVAARADIHTQLSARLEQWTETLTESELKTHSRFLTWVLSAMEGNTGEIEI